jgi:hypothetical protein
VLYGYLKIMLGESLRNWFELFSGIAVYHINDKGSDDNEGWININEFEKRFIRERLVFAGKPYDPSDNKQRNQLLNAIIYYASLLCEVKLLERQHKINPTSLEYRVTKLGRKIDKLGYGTNPGLRKRLIFAAIYRFFWIKKYWKIVSFGALGWAIINAYKFYSAAFNWISNDLFAVISALGIALLLWARHKIGFWGQ